MTTNEKNLATLTHLSQLTQYFIPFGNFIFPILLWSSKKTESEHIDSTGKNVINFQLSLFLYTMITLIVALPTLLFTVLKHISFHELSSGSDLFSESMSMNNITGIVLLALIMLLLFFVLKIIEFILIIYGTVKTSNGETYRYPLTIQFIK